MRRENISTPLIDTLSLENYSSHSEALYRVERTLRENWHSPDHYCVRASLLAELGRGEEALDSLRQALVISPGFPEAIRLQEEIKALSNDPNYQEMSAEDKRYISKDYLTSARNRLTENNYEDLFEPIIRCCEGGEVVKDSNLLAGITFLQFNMIQEASRSVRKELENFPDNVAAQQLLNQLPEVKEDEERREKKYIMLYTGLANKHAPFIFQPLFDALEASPDYEVTMITRDGVIGSDGGEYQIGQFSLPRKPDAVVVFKVWWDDEYTISCLSRLAGIPVIMLNHGAMFIKNDHQVHKLSIFPAHVGCLWGQHDLNIWRKWNTHDEFVVTGNPTYSPVGMNPERPEGLPEKYALLLTPGQGFQSDVLLRSAKNLREQIPVVAKTHPLEPRLDSLREDFLVYTEADTLIPLLYHADYLIANVTSACLPAFYWEKPLFVHSYQTPHYHYDDFYNEWKDEFNFKTDANWSEGELEGATKPSKETYSHFAGNPAEDPAENIIEVIKRYIGGSVENKSKQTSKESIVTPLSANSLFLS